MTQRDQLGQINSKIDETHRMLERVVRGIYGDPDNNVKGLLQRQDDDDAKWKEFEPLIGNIQKAPDSFWSSNLSKFPNLVAAYEFWTSKVTWVVISSISGGLFWLIFNWDNVKNLFR